ncbi:MarR family transcriptional regulator [Bradyrhizobium brasilense]|uniref:MarR family winged helix-turn-helix transcriptional regulator n=1 Tax=Bradyrhizobium brasilense TaxID=1419277 RepID=UPI0024B285DD|nr:MarR family transcriptional regulator [Bradyrhizobium australafricanum]WFU35487.1 MarR family transcriptional regulator [Bradyrhizobium australafricanum]
MRIQRRNRDITQLRRQLMDASRRLRHEATADDRSWARLLVLGAIDRHGEAATPSVLAADEGMRSSNLAATLRSLEARNLIVRTPDTEDRRKVRLRLSSAGQRFLDDSRASGERWLTEAMDAYLTASERSDLIKAGALLDRITAYSKAAMRRSRKS